MLNHLEIIQNWILHYEMILQMNTEMFGLDVSYNFEIDYKVPYNITDISFCAARDVSLNSAGDDFSIENDYVLSNKTSATGSNSLMDANGGFKKHSFDSTFFDTNQIYDSVEYYGIGSGEKFVEVSLFYTKNSATHTFRRIFRKIRFKWR